MSHFSVVVIGDDVDAQMAPYQENNMGDCPQEYLTFNDVEEELRNEYATEGSLRVIMPSGELKYPFDEEFRVSGTFGTGADTHQVPAHLEQRTIPFNELYASFDEFATEYHGYKQRDPITGRFGYWENPNRKWDWYVVGGRWNGFFQLKRGAVAIENDSDNVGRRPQQGSVNMARKADIDFEGMAKHARNKANAVYDTLEAIFQQHGRPTPFSAYRDSMDIDAARTAYWAQESVKALHQAQLMPILRDFDETYGSSRDEYVKKCVAQVGVPFAVVKDGKWYEKGSMGWFGCVSDEKDPLEWAEQYQRLIDSLPEGTLLTVVDCHI